MAESQQTYRVVRYVDQFPLGRSKEIIRTGMSLDEAEQVMNQSQGVIEPERVNSTSTLINLHRHRRDH